MSKNLREAFDSIHADPALKESTRAFLREKTGNYTAPEPRRRSGGFRRLAPALACAALLVVGLSGYQAYFTPTSAISIDINPSVELEINRFDRVITVEGLNDDGTALAAELNVRFLSYDDALEQIIASDAIQQCLADDGLLSIVVRSSAVPGAVPPVRATRTATPAARRIWQRPRPWGCPWASTTPMRSCMPLIRALRRRRPPT